MPAQSQPQPDLDRPAIEKLLKAYLGVEAVIWLGQGLEDDETDGHVDNVACFAAPGRVLLHVTDDRRDGNYAACRDNLEGLEAARVARGRRLEVIRLSQPARRVVDGARLAFYGHSFIAGTTGEIVAELGAGEEKAIVASFDLGEARAARASRGLFRDRRPDLYSPLLSADGKGGLRPARGAGRRRLIPRRW